MRLLLAFLGLALGLLVVAVWAAGPILLGVRDYEGASRWHRGLLGVVLPFLVLGCLAWRTHDAAAVWQSNLTLWQHAARLAPFKPRPLMNYGAALLEAGQAQAGMNLLIEAQRVANQPHVLEQDRRITRQLVSENLGALLIGASQDLLDCNVSRYEGTTGLPYCGDVE